MTRYEHGFITKCAEYGLDEEQSFELMQMKKQAANPLNKILSSLYRKGIGFMTSGGIRRGAGELTGKQLAGKGVVTKLFGKDWMRVNPTYWKDGLYILDSAAQSRALGRALQV